MSASDEAMLQLFRTEVDSHCQALQEGLTVLSDDVPVDLSLVNELLRAAHSIKGAAQLVDKQQALALAKAVEAVLTRCQQWERLSPGQAQALRQAVDRLRSLSERDMDAGQLNSLLQTLEAIDQEEVPASAVVAVDTATSAQDRADPTPAEPPSRQNPDLAQLFQQEIDTQTTTLSEHLLGLENRPEDPALLDSLMRASHSIKGAARMMGLEPAVQLAHRMEDCFVAAQQGTLSLTADIIDGLLRGTDLLVALGRPGAQMGEADALGQDVQRSLKRLDALLHSGSTPPAAMAEPKPPAQPREHIQPASSAAPRVLRISAERVNRLVGLAGELSVSGGWLRAHSQQLLDVKRRQSGLISALDRLQEHLEQQTLSEQTTDALLQVSTLANQCRQSIAERINSLEEFDRRHAGLSSRLNQEVIASRMRPFQDGVQGFRRMVRDVAQHLGKQVELKIEGLETQVDRDILEKIEAPLNHILRNSLDHGLETPAERRAVGKPDKGRITLRAFHAAGMLSIVVQDDGRGVDLEALRARVVERGMVSESMARDLSQSELLDFLFLPAFSTRDQVSELSGRGVGLDVVHSVVQEMRGQIRASTEPGHGLRLQLLLPLTLSLVRSLVTEIGKELYAFPLARVEAIMKLHPSAIKSINDRQYFTFEGRHIGLVDAVQVLNHSATPAGETMHVVVLGDRTEAYGLVVDCFQGERNLAVRALDARLGKIKDISAAAISEQGEPILIIDVDDMFCSIQHLANGRQLHKIEQASAQTEPAAKRILVVDDSLTVREVERKLLENRGYQVDVAVDGMDGWNCVRLRSYDLVISDVDMPRMNGIEFVSMIKSDARLKVIPVMIVSYKDREEDRDRGLDAGADYYLAKGSFHDETLVNAVLDLIGEANS